MDKNIIVDELLNQLKVKLNDEYLSLFNPKNNIPSSEEMEEEYKKKEENLNNHGINLIIPEIIPKKKLLCPGELCVIGGFQASCKTLYLINIIYYNTFVQKRNTILISLDKSKKSIIKDLSIIYNDPLNFIKDFKDKSKSGELLIIENEDFKGHNPYDHILKLVTDFYYSLEKGQIDLLAIDSVSDFNDIINYKKNLNKNLQHFIPFLKDIPKTLNIPEFAIITIIDVSNRSYNSIMSRIDFAKWNPYNVNMLMENVISEYDFRINMISKSLEDHEKLYKDIEEAKLINPELYTGKFEPEKIINNDKIEIIKRIKEDIKKGIDESKKEKIKKPYGSYYLSNIVDSDEIIELSDVFITLWCDAYCKRKNMLLMQLLKNKEGETIDDPFKIIVDFNKRCINDLFLLRDPKKINDHINSLLERSFKYD